MKQVPFDENRIDTEVYERVPADGELVLRDIARGVYLRAPLVDNTLLLATERSSLHRKLLAIFG